MTGDPYELERFVAAQDDGGSYLQALRELQQGAKRSHWMWYVFPQVAGLGHSAMAQRYAIRSLEEARAYLAHPLLGQRLHECVAALNDLLGTTAERVFGSTDAMKLRSSMTLFARAAPEQPLFAQILDRYLDGRPDPATEERI